MAAAVFIGGRRRRFHKPEGVLKMPASRELQFVCRVLRRTHGDDLVHDLTEGVPLSDFGPIQEQACRDYLRDTHSIDVDAVKVPSNANKWRRYRTNSMRAANSKNCADDLLAAGRLGSNNRDAIERIGLALAKRKAASV